MRTDGKSIIQVVVVGLILAWALWSRTLTPGPITPTRAIGIVLMIAGFTGWVVARVQLGRSFSVSPKATELVTHGIYSKIRNPVYSFGTVIMVGFILWLNKPIWLLVLVVVVPLQLIRARKEAQVLEAKFGDAYRAYRAKTWF